MDEGRPIPVPVLSVIICTRDRGATLVPAVRSVLADAPADGSVELLVVDQGLDGAVAEALADVLDVDTRLTYLRERSVGLSAARNAGLRAARGELIAFTDDDCVVESGWIAALKVAFATHPEAGLVFGHVACAEHDHTQGYLPGFGARNGFLTRRSMLAGAGHWGMGANMALRRTAWERIGPFDEQLGAGAPLRSAEDVDYALRARRQGIGVLHWASARVVHYGFRPWSQASTLMKGASLGIGAMYAKHLRDGSALAFLLLLSDLRGRAWDIARNLARRGHPLGANALLYQLKGIGRGWRLPLDRRARATGPVFLVSEKTHMVEAGGERLSVPLPSQGQADELPFISVIIPVWNRCEDLRDTLLQLQRQTYDRYEVLVVDNASTEPVSPMVREQYPAVRLFTLAENRGPVVARNLGMREARGEIVLFLDSDTVPEDQALEKFARKFAAEPDLGVASGLQYDATTGKPWWWWTQHGYDEEHYLHVEFETAFKFEEGAAAARKDVVLAVGGYAEDFFIAAEGRDLAARITDAGYRVMYWPEVTFLHKAAQRLKTNRWYRSDGRLYFEFRNEFWYTVKYFPLPLLLVKTTLNLVRNFRRAVEHHALLEFLRAYRDALRGLPSNLRRRRVLKPATIYKITSARYKKALGPLVPGRKEVERELAERAAEQPVEALSGV